MPRSLLYFRVPWRAWARRKRFAHRAAEVQSFVLLTILYWIVVVPVGALRRPRATQPPAWIERRPAGRIAVEDARRQF